MKRYALLIVIFLLLVIAASGFYINTTNRDQEPEGVAIEIFTKFSGQTLGLPTTEKETASENAGLDVLGPLWLKKTPQKKWWHDAVVYQIWPRSYYDTDGDGNGDLKGVTKKLDYLKALGITAIWLNPIFESNSTHGYDVIDYYQIEKDLGSMDDFEELITAAKTSGIKVILDLALNHVSNDHPWFIKSANKEPGYEDFFVWSETLPAGYGKAWSDQVDPQAVWHYVADNWAWKTTKTRKDWYYGAFDPSQPDLNFKNPAVIKEIEQLTKFWIDKGVDGFRLDAIRYIIEEGGIPLQADTAGTLNFWKHYSTYVKSINPDIFLVGEAFADSAIAARYFSNGRGLDAAFDFSFGLTVSDTLKTTTAITTDDTDTLNQHYQRMRETLWYNLYHKHQSSAPMYFFAKALNNHDIDRIHNHFSENHTLANIAAALLLTTPGTPFIYYGDEINMQQLMLGNDIYRRAPMQWNSHQNAGFSSAKTTWIDQPATDTQVPVPPQAVLKTTWETNWNTFSKRADYTVAQQENNPDSTLMFYQRLIALRQNDAVLKLPEKVMQYNHTGSALIVKYEVQNDSRWVILNLNPTAETTFNLPADIHGNHIDLLNKTDILLAQQLTLTAGELLILKPTQ
ncbi:alpha-amylase family glycosyl hydrolase [Cellvibrio japonicus]|uniref:Alpha amylase, putative, amy13A n=1 Tax=Cellvibrio japonicus (strain Ueda107) TaxID=498211 RepID=B3PLJ8_CELJU|nr:alpha-amylase family glycosyl hydrolase [Cellvibrio japonicus]ACE83192.1 alpha amylase, putative, amy13A [Cellvibrio japonicus Ueda107]